MASWKLPVAALLALTAFSRLSASLAANKPKPPKPPKESKGAPAPMAGAGLPLLAVTAGAYWAIRRRMKRAEEQRLE